MEKVVIEMSAWWSDDVNIPPWYWAGDKPLPDPIQFTDFIEAIKYANMRPQ